MHTQKDFATWATAQKLMAYGPDIFGTSQEFLLNDARRYYQEAKRAWEIASLAAEEEATKEAEEARECHAWQCQYCLGWRPQQWYRYRVKEKREHEWIENCCATCARKMFSDGPFKGSTVES